MASNESSLDSLPPSAQLALLHAQAAAAAAANVTNTELNTTTTTTTTMTETVATIAEEDKFVPSPDDPVVMDNSHFEPLISGDFPTPIGKKPVTPVKKETPSTKKNIDLSSEAAFPSLSASASPRTPVVSGWSANAASRLKSSPQAPVRTRAMAPSTTGKKNTSTPITDVLELPANQQIANAQNKPLGFKGNADVIQKVMNRTGTNIIASTNRSGTTTCLIQGQPADVARAKKELINGLLIKRVYSVDIPVSVRRFIIGPKGTTLRQIEEKSNTRINFARKEEEDFDENDPDDTIPLTIVGYVTDIMIAKEEIEKIVAEKRAKQTIKIDQFDAKYYPFIAGPHNSNIKKLEEEFDVKIHVPFIAIDGNNVNSSPITITGDKEKAQAAKQALEKNYVTIESTGTVVSINASKRQQKYFRGNSEIFKEIFNETGCTVELPSQDDASESIVVRGPETQVVQALSLVMAKVKAVHISVLDLAQIYSSYGKDSLTYARYALKYLLDKRALKGIEKEHSVQTSVPSDEELEKSVYVEFISKEEKDAAIAQLALTNAVRKLTPDRFSTIKIDAYLHQHILNTYRARIQRIKEAQQVDIIFPGEKDQDILIVYEGDDKAAVKDALAAASAALKEIVADSSDYVSKSLSIPANYHDLIRGPKGTTLNAVLGLNSGVTVRFGPNDTVEVRGFSKQVNHAISEINKTYQEAQDKNFAKPYSSEFSIPSNFSAHVIGKSGANINKLKEDFGVRIDFGDSDKTEEKVNGKDSKKKAAPPVKVTIQGIKTNVEAAKAHINAQVAMLADQVTLSLKVPKEFHRYLIGPSGRYVKKLEDKYNVFIKFPKSTQGDESPSTGNPDEILVRGGKKSANAAKEELLELYEYEKEEQEKRKERELKQKQYEEKRNAEEKRKAEEKASKKSQ